MKKLKSIRNEDGTVSVIEVDLSPEEIAEAHQREAEWNAKAGERAREAARDKRAQEYPSIGDQLDAIWKQINQDRLGGKNLIQEADDILGKILSVKASNPLPEDEQ